MIIANISRIINLNGFKYNVWKCKMGDLYVKGCYLSVFVIDKPKNKTYGKWNIFQTCMWVYSTIGQWVNDSILNYISMEAHARTLWGKLEQ